ncbi:oxygenase MpaB family protein [Burkholderia cenocepacia]|uniref:oxygenase MpaB family protein n=1 Tax=Burkholderia cenocepacia TaxID=95486 RepID=UPI00406C2768
MNELSIFRRTPAENLTDSELTTVILQMHENRNTPPACCDYGAIVQGEKAKILARMFGRISGYTPHPREEIGQRLSMAMWKGDPLCDAAMLKMVDRGQSPHSIMEDLITRGIDAIADPTEELVELWKQISTRPEWVDWDRIERGARVYRRYGVQGFTFQGIGSLDTYRFESIARTLMSTGQYSDGTAFGRFLLTCNFWMEVSEPGGMNLFALGWQLAVRVRLLHSLIRRSVIASGKWDAEKLGMPINQVGLHGAPIVSSIMLGQFTKILGYRPTNAEIEDMTHLWRYIAYIMGATAEFLPKSVHEGIQISFDAFNVERQTDDEDSIRLCQSFINSFSPKGNSSHWDRLKDWVHHKSIVGQTLLFVTPETIKVSRLPNPLPWGLLFLLLQFPRNFVQDLLRHRFPQYAERLDARKRRERRAWINRYLNSSVREYRYQPKR